MPASKATAVRNVKQPYMIISFKEKRHQTSENRIKITMRIPRKLKPQSKVRIGNVVNRECVFANHSF